MPNSKLSHSTSLLLLASLFGTICLGFGINAILRPAHALTFFEFEPPVSAAERRLVDNLMIIYGIRDCFMAVAVYAAAYFGSRKSLGAILIAIGGVAFVDGLVCWREGAGEWGHWGYAPVAAVLGSVLCGAMDRA